MSKKPDLKAALVVIGDEILSGQTQDINLRHIALRLSEKGIYLSEVRVVPDVGAEIVDAVKALRDRADFVFTTGGIGPTHDDITADNVARAFGVEMELNGAAAKMLADYYNPRGIEVTPARLKMAMIPKGAKLVPNPVSGAPGFILENVYVMAGVPHIMQAMLENICKELPDGAPIQKISIEADAPESSLAGPLEALQRKYPDVAMGSYPYRDGERWTATLVLRSRDEALLAKAAAELKQTLEKLRP